MVENEGHYPHAVSGKSTIGRSIGPEAASRLRSKSHQKVRFDDLPFYKTLDSKHGETESVRSHLSKSTLSKSDKRLKRQRHRPNWDELTKTVRSAQSTPHGVYPRTVANFRLNSLKSSPGILKTVSIGSKTRFNTYIYDKYAAKYNFDQMELALDRSATCALYGMLAVTTLFIGFAIVVDYIHYKTYLLDAATYEVISSLDMGLVSSPREGKFGWPIFLTLMSFLGFLLLGGFSTRSWVVVLISCVISYLFQILIIILALVEKLDEPFVGKYEAVRKIRPSSPARCNLVFLIALAALVLCWTILRYKKLVLCVKKMHERAEFPEESTLITRQALAKNLHDAERINMRKQQSETNEN